MRDRAVLGVLSNAICVFQVEHPREKSQNMIVEDEHICVIIEPAGRQFCV